ncbi:MAG: hypothetical protein R3A51_18375 [Nannocystaceae bacterium]
MNTHVRSALPLVLILSLACQRDETSPQRIAPVPKKAPTVAAKESPTTEPRATSECDAARLPEVRAAAADGDLERISAEQSAALQRLLARVDSETGRADAERAAALLVNTGPDEPRARELAQLLDAAMTAWMRHHLERAADTASPIAARQSSWELATCAFEHGPAILSMEASAAPEGDAGATLVEEARAALASGRRALADADADARERVLQPARQRVEKSAYRAIHRALLLRARAAKDDPQQASAALAAFRIIEDRMQGKNTPGAAVITAALSGDPTRLDAEAIARELAVAFAKRTRKYCSHALEHPDEPLADRLASAAEGSTYALLLLPDMTRRLADAGFDAIAYRRTWEDYAQELEVGDDPAELARLSGELVRWNCAYQEALGIAECTANVDEVAPAG